MCDLGGVCEKRGSAPHPAKGSKLPLDPLSGGLWVCELWILHSAFLASSEDLCKPTRQRNTV